MMISLVRSLAFYICFYLGSALIVIAVAVLGALWPRVLRPMCRSWAIYHRFCLRWLTGIKVVVEGEAPQHAVLVAIRHESFFEAIDMLRLFDHPVGFAKAELLRIPLWGASARQYGLVPVERDQGAKALRAMLTAARKGAEQNRPLIIFPEGTRVPHGQAGELRSGFAGIYKLLALPVVPIAVNSGPPYHRWWKRPGVITYRVGEVIPSGLPREEIETRVQQAIEALNHPNMAT